MRHSSPAVRGAQTACIARYQALKGPITDALRNRDYYPWSLLAALEAPKFFSDLVESVLGAIYIDTRGSLEACEAFLERLEILPYLRRVMERGDGMVAMKHPKEELGVVADSEKVRYEILRVKANEEGDGKEDQIEDGGRPELRCRVWVGERLIVEIGRGSSVIEIETRAAEKAVRVLKGRRSPDFGKGNCDDAEREV